MEHRREPYINQPDQGRLHQRRGGSHQHAIPIVGFRSGNGPTIDRGNLNGDDLHFGIRRRRTRSSQSEEEMLLGSLEAAGAFGSYGSPIAHGEPQTWYTRSSGQEQAESAPQRRVANTGNATLSSSPRNQGHQGSPGNQKTPGHQGSPGNQKTPGHQGSPGNQKTPGHQGSPGNQGNQSFKGSRTLTFHSKRPNGQHQKSDDEYGSSPGTPRHQSSKGSVRSTSENEPYGMSPKGRGAPRRRRGNSETEGRPQRDNINMSGLQCLAQENIWFDKPRYDEAEKRFYEGANGSSTYPQEREASAILQEIAKARQNIQQSLDGVKTALQGRNNRPLKRQHRNSSHANGDHDLVARMKSLELENNSLHKVVQDMRAVMMKLESRVAVLEKQPKGAAAPVPSAKPAPVHQVKDDDDDDDIDLFGSDSEDDAEAERIKQERVAAYTAKKSKKPALIAKSSILLDVKPWDDETDMAKLEECVRSVQADGLLWGQSKLVPVGYGIKKLQINCVVEDDKVGTDMLEEEITKYEDYVQSVDVAAFNKI